MSTALRRTFATLALLALCLIPMSGGQPAAQAQEEAQAARADTPLPLFENKGQLAESVDFHLQGTAHEILLRKTGIQLSTYGQNASSLGLAFVDADAAAPEGVFQWPNNVQFLFADNPDSPLGGVPAFSGAHYDALYQSVRAIVEAKIDPDDHFILRRTLEITDPDVVKSIIFAYPGNQGLSVAEDGSLIIDVGLNPKLGEVKDILKVYHVDDSFQREPIEAAFVLNGDGTAYVEAETVTVGRPLYIEASLDYTVMMEPYAEMLGEMSKMPMAPEREIPFSLPTRGMEPAPILAAAIGRAQAGAATRAPLIDGPRIGTSSQAKAPRVDAPAALKALVVGQDFGGADLVVADGDVLSGVFLNVGRFHVPTGVTAFVDSGVPLYVYADEIDIQGTLNGVGHGFAGGIATDLRGAQGVAGSGPGGGARGMMGPIVHGTGGGGGGHGATGGAGMTLVLPLAAPGGDAYDFEIDKIQMGSGGGGAANHATASFARGGAGGNGGAAVYLEAETVALGGEILVDGTDGEEGVSGDAALAVSGGGGGAGGGILIRGAFTCSASAVLSARGGLGADATVGGGWGTGGGGGAGGRVKFIGAGDTANCGIEVEGGAAGTGTPGTWMPATPGGPGGVGAKNGDAVADEIALETVAADGAEGSVDAIESLDQPTNLCTTTLFSFSNLVPVTILDSTLVTSSINVAGTGGFLADIDVTTNIIHTFGSDLDIMLTSPLGTISTLSTDNAAGNDNVFNGTLWDDDANPGSPASAQPQPPIQGLVTDHTYTNLVTATPLVPEEAMGAFQGQNPNGIWTLSIFDDAGGDTGTVTWTISMRTCAAAPSTSLTSVSNLISTPINDNVTNISTISVAGAPTVIADVNALTNILHTAPVDLDMSITSPAGTSVTLSTDNGLSNVFNGTTWDDSADPGGPASLQTPNTTSFVVTDRTYTANVTSTPLVPEEAMAAFIGENPNGIWTIQIFDDLAGITGSFTWSLAIQAFTPGAPGPTVADLAIEKTTLPAGQATVIAGNNLVYRVIARNLGPSSITGVTIDDTLPVGTVFVSAVPSPGAPDGSCTFTAATQLVRCTWVAAVPAGASTGLGANARFVDITVKVCPDRLCNTTLANRAVVGIAGQVGPIYTQPFTTSAGDFVLENDTITTANWVFANNCTSSNSNLGAGHTVPGTLRWGNPAACTDYGASATNDVARTPLINSSVCSANLLLTFKYYVNFQESGSFDFASVDVSVIVGGAVVRAAAVAGTAGGTGQVTLINDGVLNNASPPWQQASINVGTLLGTIPPSMVLQFRGQTLDGIGNTGNGFVIDDVTVNCDRGASDPNIANNSTILNTTVQTQSSFNITKTANRREVATGNEVTYTIVSRNLGPSNANGMIVRDTLPPNFIFVAATTSRGACTAATPEGSTQTVVTCNVGVLGAPAALQAGCVTTPLPDTVTVTIRALAASNISEATAGCPEGLVNNVATVTTTNCLPDLGVLNATAATCVVPKVDPNSQLGCQVHLPILNFQGQDDVCEAMIEVQYLGCVPAKAVLVTWGEPGFCPPQAAGPLKVECTGLLVPGSSWIIQDAQVPTGSKSGILFKFTAEQLSDVGLDDDLGFDDVVADLMCEELFFGVVGDADDYRRFKKAYNEGLTFRGIPQDIAMGSGALAVEVLRRCPGDLTPGVDVTSKYNGIAGDHLGRFDSIFGGFSYYVPLLYADKGGLNTVMYIQNGGLECSSLEIWFKAQDDCLRARICDVTTLAPGESYQYDATDCVGPDWQGSAWIRSSEPMGIAVDIYGRDILMTYVAEPAPFNYIFSTDDDPEFKLFRPGNQVLFGPLIYSEYQGWDTGVQVQNIDPSKAAKVKVYFLDRSGDIITTLVDWICPRGSQTYFLPVVAKLPGSWVGSIRVESQEWWNAGSASVRAPSIVGVAQLIKYTDVARTNTEQAIAYSLLPEHKAYNWQIGFADGGLDQGVGLIAIPSFLKDLDGDGVTTEVAIMNLAEKPGFTDFAIYIYDQNGLLDFVCQKLHDRQVEYIDLQTWGYVSPGFKGSAIISATFWEHDVFNPTGEFVRNLVGLGAVSVERTNARLGEDMPGDEAAGDRGIPFRNDGQIEFCFPEGFVPKCPGQPVFP